MTARWINSILSFLRFQNEKHLIDQFFVTLSVAFDHIKNNYKEGDNYASRGINEIESLLSGDRTWLNAYEAEQRIAFLLKGDHLEKEFQRRMLDGRENLSSQFCDFYSQAISNCEEQSKSLLLMRLVGDLQWHYELRRERNTLDSMVRTRTWVFFVISFMCFFIPYLLPGLAGVLHVIAGTKSYYIFTSISAGFMGAAFSMLLRLNSTIESSGTEDLKSLSRYSYIFARMVIGMGAALIFFYVLQSGVVSGSFFPTFPEVTYKLVNDADSTRNIAEPVKLMSMEEKSLALLVLWSFIAGFSEQLVPNVLSATEGKIK